MSKKLISVIIPSYNRKQFIEQAIESVLKQNYKNVEIIIVDDGSTDGTENYIMQKYETNKIIKFYRNEKNLGAGASRKKGYCNCNGSYVVFMDDDDYYTNNSFFEEAVKILEEKPNISFVSSNSTIEYINENKTEQSIMNIKGEIKSAEYLKFFQTKYMKSSSTFTTVFRKSSLENAGLNDVEMVNDSTIYLRALLSGDAYILELISGIYRIHSNNISFGLSVDFIIENLIEKKKVYEEIKRRKILDNPDEWIKNQVLLTTNYFIKNNLIKDEDFNKLIEWCNINLQENRAEIIEQLFAYRGDTSYMKKIFIMAYARKNLGDDLFIKMLLDKYKNMQFYMKVNNYSFVDKLSKYQNLHILEGDDTDEELYKMDVGEYDAYVYVGGSIFMEGGKVYNLSPKFYDFVERCKKQNKPFCYISSNYGPYQTEEYLNLSKKNFATCTDICFRDLYSYNLFKDIPSVRYAPDFAFSYPLERKEKIKDSIGISVIDLGIRSNLKDNINKYYNMLINNIKNYLQSGKTIYLYSFCKHEGDEVTVDRILEEFKDNSKVIGVRYDGDVDEFLNLYSRMEYMICARFHAMILSVISRQKMFIMSYSNKIDNVVNDLNLELPIIHFEDISDDITINLDNFKSVSEEKILEIIKESRNQDKAFKDNLLDV